MRNVLLHIVLLFGLGNCFGQTWQTIPEWGTYERAPYGQFLINPYTNDIWINSEDQVSVIKNDGTIFVFNNGELGSLYIGDNLQFAFTPQHVYYAYDYTALYSFDNYIPQAEYIFNSFQQTEYRSITSNGDTVYIGFNTPYFSTDFYYRKHVNGSTISSGHPARKLIANNQQIYGNFNPNSDLYYYTGPNYNDYNYLIGNPFGPDDPDYLGGYHNDLKFSRYTDTLYIASDFGINLTYAYDVFDSITPTNTTSMPSSKVLEIEFDNLDSLWAVFGDANGDPFAIGKLEGNTWTNIFDTSNSPIDFSTFMGLEIDTLGNIWVIDEDALHTLIGPNSPTWLGEIESSVEGLGIYPNPGQNILNLQIDQSIKIEQLVIEDINGRIVLIQKFDKTIDISTLNNGVYYLTLKTDQDHVLRNKIVVQK